jgi:hypothetical protein
MKVFPRALGTQEWTPILKEALRLPDATLEVANRWLREQPSALLESGELVAPASRGAKEINVSEEDLVRILAAVYQYGFYIADDKAFEGAVQDLAELEQLTEEERARFPILMNRLRFPRGKLALRETWAANSVVPVVTDVRAFCDLRAVFSEFAAPGAGDKVAEFASLVPVVLLSLDIRDESGREHSVAVQFSEATFAIFKQVVENANAQLSKILEIRQNVLTGEQR